MKREKEERTNQKLKEVFPARERSGSGESEGGNGREERHGDGEFRVRRRDEEREKKCVDPKLKLGVALTVTEKGSGVDPHNAKPEVGNRVGPIRFVY